MPYTPRKNPEERRRQILDAATELFYVHGYQKASLRDISRKVQVTQAAIYYHFQNKEEILFAIIDEFSNRLDRALRACLGQDKDPIEKFRETIKTHLSYIETDHRSIKILIEDKRFLGHELGGRIKRREKSFYNLYKAHLQEMQEAGLLRDIDLTAATFGTFGQLNWLYHWYRPDGGLPMERIAEDMVKMILFGLVKERTR